MKTSVSYKGIFGPVVREFESKERATQWARMAGVSRFAVIEECDDVAEAIHNPRSAESTNVSLWHGSLLKKLRAPMRICETMTAREWHAAILAANPDRPVSLRTVYYWIKKGTAPAWALKLRNGK